MAFQAVFLATLVLAPSLVSSQAILPVVGPSQFDVITTSALLTDPSRLDPFAKDGRARSIMVSSFYPVPVCRRKQLEAYMPPATAVFQDVKFGAYGLPNGSLQSLNVQTCNATTTRNRCASDSPPLVLFSGALGTSRLLYSNMLQSVAAAGYLVVSLDHPYDADFVEFINGSTITGVDITDADLELALTTRVEDIAFLHRQISNSSTTNTLFPGHKQKQGALKTALLGHSLGGAAVAATMLQIPSILGGFNIDGSMFGPVLEAGLDRPFMVMGHENKTRETDPSWKTIWPQLKGWKKEFEVRGAAHYSFSDLPLITSVLDLQDKLPAEVGEVLGTLEGRRMAKLTVTYVTEFLDMVLKSGSGKGLEESKEVFPEVIEVV